MEYLDLSDNELSGDIPLALGSVSHKLRHLDIRGNSLSGEIPPVLANLSELQGLFLSGNRLAGEIPSVLGSLTNLVWLQLDGNLLSGPIPPELGMLSNLLWLHLSGNQLVGEIPTELGSLDNLKRLRLGEGNRLTGCVPDGLKDVPAGDLGALSLQFCGGASPAQGSTDMPAADRAVLAALYDAMDGANWRSRDNWLSDAPLDEWHGVTTDDGGRVTLLDLRHNRLSGEIPSQLVDLPGLEGLWVGGSSSLTGCIPEELRHLSGGDLGRLGLPFCQTADPPETPGGTPHSDRAVLVALYDSLDGLRWRRNTNWLSDAPIGEWAGVGTDDSGRVMWLFLSPNPPMDGVRTAEGG